MSLRSKVVEFRITMTHQPARIYQLRAFAVFALLPLVVFAAGCRRDMQDQPKYVPLRALGTPLFPDGSSARPLVDGTIPRGFLNEDKMFFTGKINAPPGATPPQSTTGPPQSGGAGQPAANVNATGSAASKIPTGNPQIQPAGDKSDATAFPFPITAEALERGQQRYQIFCSVCHGLTGYGDGMIVRRGYKRPPSFHDDRLRQAPVGYYFDVITNGFGAMPDYASQIPAQDRWMVIAYIRALQLSQQMPMTEVPASERAKLAQTNPGAVTNTSGGPERK